MKSFYCNCQFIFFYCFTHFFSSAISLFFFLSFFLINLMNMNKWVVSFTVLSFMFNFNSRKSKQTLSSTFNTKSTSQINKLKYLLFKTKIQSNFFYSLAWSAIATQGRTKCNSACCYILIFEKLFHVYKLIHID